MDVVDEQSSSGKLDLIIQLPYIIKTEARRQQAEKRRQDIVDQLAGSKYGIALYRWHRAYYTVESSSRKQSNETD